MFMGSHGAVFSHHVFDFERSVCKYEVFWQSENQTCAEFPPEIHCQCLSSGGVQVLGSPIAGTQSFFTMHVCINRVIDAQE